jgi:hypothetical protein
MGRATGFSSASNPHNAAGPPRTRLQADVVCARCNSHAAFDGNAGEWCPRCRTSAHLTTRRRLYRLVDVDLDLDLDLDLDSQ